MTLRRRGPEAQVPISSPCVIVSSHPVPVVRFELAHSSLSFLTGELRQWEWLPLETGERLRIRAGPESILISGKNLLPLRHALDQLRLQLVREIGLRKQVLGTQPWVERIELERKPGTPPSFP